jgi:hypothetical protein
VSDQICPISNSTLLARYPVSDSPGCLELDFIHLEFALFGLEDVLKVLKTASLRFTPACDSNPD